MRLWAEVPMHTNVVSPISRHHRRAPLPLLPTSSFYTLTRVPSPTKCLGTHPEVGPRRACVFQGDKSPSPMVS